MENLSKWAWGQVISALAAPGEAAATRVGLTGGAERNAFIHAYTSAILVYNGVGAYKGSSGARASDTADFLGRLKENVPGYFGSNEFRDYYKDVWNDAVGIDVGLYAKNNLFSLKDLERLVYNSLKDGALIVDKFNSDPRIPSDPNKPYSEWPIAVPPLYRPYNDGSKADWNEQNCFRAGTLILMADKTLKPIEKIRVDDLVLAFSQNSQDLKRVSLARPSG